MLSQTLFLVVTETKPKKNVYVCEHLTTFPMGIGKETSFNPYVEAPYVRVQLTCALCALNWVLVKLFNLFDNVIQKYFVFFSFSIYLI